MTNLKDLLIHDICVLDQMASILAERMGQIDLRDLPEAELLDLKNALTNLYLAFENAIIRDTIRKRNEDNETTGIL